MYFSLSIITTSKQKISQDIKDLNNPVKQPAWLTPAEHDFRARLFQVYETFSNTDHTLNRKLKKIVIPSTFSDNDGIILAFNNRKRSGKSPNI